MISIQDDLQKNYLFVLYTSGFNVSEIFKSKVRKLKGLFKLIIVDSVEQVYIIILLILKGPKYRC